MNVDSLDVALRNVSETKALLETLIHSSESFDYPNAKQALKALQRKTRELGRLQGVLEQSRPAWSNIAVLDFSGGTNRPAEGMR